MAYPVLRFIAQGSIPHLFSIPTSRWDLSLRPSKCGSPLWLSAVQPWRRRNAWLGNLVSRLSSKINLWFGNCQKNSKKHQTTHWSSSLNSAETRHSASKASGGEKSVKSDGTSSTHEQSHDVFAPTYPDSDPNLRDSKPSTTINQSENHPKNMISKHHNLIHFCLDLLKPAKSPLPVAAPAATSRASFFALEVTNQRTVTDRNRNQFFVVHPWIYSMMGLWCWCWVVVWNMKLSNQWVRLWDVSWMVTIDQ